MRIFTGKERNDLDGLVRILEPLERRAEFELAIRKFAISIERILPNRIPVEILNDLRWLAYIRIAAKARYEPDTGLDISDCGEKVRKLISDHLEAHGILPWIAPLRIFDADFEEKVSRLGSDEAVASAMEHAAKREIHIRLDKNPVFYTSLLEKLQRILDETEADWETRRTLLKKFIDQDIVEGETKKAETLRMSAEEFAYFEVARQKLGLTSDGHLENPARTRSASAEANDEDFVPDALQLAKRIALDVAKVVQENCVVDWSLNPVKVADLERGLLKMLTSGYHAVLPFADRKTMVADLVAIAKRHRGGL